MTFELTAPGTRMPVVIMVSKADHCLNDLLYRYRTGTLGIEIPAVVSNHEELRPFVEAAGIRYHHVPVTAATKPEAEAVLIHDGARCLVDPDLIDRCAAAVLAGDAVIDLTGARGFAAARFFHQFFNLANYFCIQLLFHFGIIISNKV